MDEASYKLDELARAAGTSPRTVRYYVQRGLLPAPAFRGKDTAYGAEHLARLRAIRRLQEDYLPLDAIAAELDGKSVEDMERIAAGKLAARAPAPRAERRASRLEGARSFRKITLARGVELVVDDDAPADSLRLVQEILERL